MNGSGEHLDALQPFDRCDAVPVRHDQPHGRAVIGVERFAVHLVGDQDLGQRDRQHARASTSARSRGRRHRCPSARGRGCTTRDPRRRKAPLLRCQAAWLARSPREAAPPSSELSRRRSRPMARRPAAAASQAARFPRTRGSRRARSTASISDRRGVRVKGCSTAPPISSWPSWLGHGEVAADVVQLGRCDVGLERLGRRLGVERLTVDHRQRRTFAFQIICQRHVGPPRIGRLSCI